MKSPVEQGRVELVPSQRLPDGHVADVRAVRGRVGRRRGDIGSASVERDLGSARQLRWSLGVALLVEPDEHRHVRFQGAPLLQVLLYQEGDEVGVPDGDEPGLGEGLSEERPRGLHLPGFYGADLQDAAAVELHDDAEVPEDLDRLVVDDRAWLVGGVGARGGGGLRGRGGGEAAE